MDSNRMMTRRDCMLIVDDDLINREMLKNIFEDMYCFEEAENGREALEKIIAHADRFCAILLDVDMPEMDGMELLGALKELGHTDMIPTFLITANDELELSRQAYELGVMDVISKPVVSFIIKRRVQSVIELFRSREWLSDQVVGQERKLKENADTIDELHRGTIEALASAIEFRDTESGEHTNRIYAVTKTILMYTAMGDDLTDEEIENISIGSIMHDLGKIAISDMILNKPGRLTAEEYEIMKSHTVKGAELMKRLSQLQDHPSYQYACDIAWHHHERWDGKGYPDGLVGDEITVWSQVVSIADVYDALISPRVYKKAFTPDQAVKMISGGECGKFNPKLIRCFLEVEPVLRKLYFPDPIGQEPPEMPKNRMRYFAPKPDRAHTQQETSDMLLLVSAIVASFDMIICSNLTKNSYYMMSYERFQTHCARNDGVFDELIAAGASSVPDSHRERFINAFNRRRLLKDWEEGKRTITLEHPQYGDDGEIHRVRTTVVLMEDARTGDVIDLTFACYIDQQWETRRDMLARLRGVEQQLADAMAATGVDLGNVIRDMRSIIDLYNKD